MMEGGSGSGGREGGLRKEGKSAWTERGKEVREEASGGAREQRSEGEEQRRSARGR